MSPSQDVVGLILKDHRIAGDLLRQMRSGTETVRSHALHEFADLYVAHVRAEEFEVYPELTRYEGIDQDVIERGVVAHEEGAEALLDLIEAHAGAPHTWDDRLDELVTSVTEYTQETEGTLLVDTRESVTRARRVRLGAAFAEERCRQLRACCGDLDNVRRFVSG
ncbi:hemerythrin domain-containing protein [Streptomyces sp. NPDC093510]|uniref:hemerythrin domain-containing protein n=1 Tax=Streptomyces sp. NPDC093510 TaxID=3155199 RepID=UPI003448466B